MYEKISNNVKVTVTPYYLEEQSSPNDNHYVWAYRINIENLGNKTLQLNNRNWVIIDANGCVQNIQGEGGVGVCPTIGPGQIFEYTSGTPLKTSNGIMQGYYMMSQNNGIKIKVDVPAFSLDIPVDKKNYH